MTEIWVWLPFAVVQILLVASAVAIASGPFLVLAEECGRLPPNRARVH